MYSHICITTKIEATNLKENKEGYTGGCIERKRKREIIHL